MIDEDAAWALTEIRRRRPLYATRRSYYDGMHRLAFATDKFRNAFARTFEAFADNLCTIVVDCAADLMEITGWAGGGEDTPSEEAAALWRRSRLSRVAGEIHQEAFALGDTYLIVWQGPDGRSTWFPNVAEECAVRYEEQRPGVVELGAKVWVGRDRRAHLNLYYPDRTERYATAQAVVNGIPSEPRSYLPWQDDSPPVVPNPYGTVPMFHFANGAGIGKLGRALHDQAIPLQDALNKSVLDGLVGAEAQALPQRWGTGIENPIDHLTGKPRERVWLPGDVMTVFEPEARFGDFAPANLDQLIAMSESYRLEIARVTGTPAHRLLLSGGTWPSGESLKVAHAPLTATCVDRQDAWGPTWSEAMAFAQRIEAEIGDEPAAPLWRDPSPRSEVDEVAVAEGKRRVGVSQRQVLRELGYSDEEIDTMMAENEEAARRAMDRGAFA